MADIIDLPISVNFLIIPLALGLLGVIFAWFMRSWIMKQPRGNQRMKELSNAIRTGAKAYLKKEYTYIAGISIIVFFAILVLKGSSDDWYAGLYTAIAFLIGALFSAGAGYFGMDIATQANSRTTEGARKSLNGGLKVAFRSGSVMGMSVVGLGLAGLTFVFFLLLFVPGQIGDDSDLELIRGATDMVAGFGFGASFIALFARVGGGIYTKAADVGADLVGKVEAGIPEDDPRNPATIADNVGDNVGDVAGMGADLYESYCGSILATAALGVAAASALFGGEDSGPGFHAAMRFLAAPMVLAGVGILFNFQPVVGNFSKIRIIYPGSKFRIGTWNEGYYNSSGRGGIKHTQNPY